MKKIWCILLLFTALGCGTADMPKVKNEQQAEKLPIKVKVETIQVEPEVEVVAPVETIAEVVDPVLDPAVELAAGLEIIPGHEDFARSIFDDTSDIPPWRANYVGSYGVLPTRYNDSGPFLYSFDRRVDFDDEHGRKRRRR
jgi:hypothetical protein